MTETLEGGCLCGAFRVALEGAPYRVGICHCLDCRKKTGSLFSAFAIFPVDKVTTTGSSAQHKFGANHVHYCRRCGSAVCQIQEGDDEVEVFLGILDEPSRLTPTYELWTIRREAWLPPFEGLARHYVRDREGKGRSEP